MKKLKVSLLLCLLLFATQVKATDYYFAAAGVSTTCTGVGDACPITQVASHGAAGDRLLFKKGDTFTGTISYTRSGSSGNPITFDLYGSSTNNAIIDGAGTSSAAVLTINANYITVNNLVIQNNANANGVVYLMTGTHDISFNNCYVNTGIRGINAFHCGTAGVANIKVLNSFFTNIYDTADNHPNGGGSHIQLNNCNGAGIEIAYNNFYVPSPATGNNNNNGVGDEVSLYQDNGTAASYILVHDNNFRGASNCQSTGYIWITLGDVGGSYQHVYNNIGVNGDPNSQGGFSIMPSGGTNLIEENNRSYCVFSTNIHNAVGMGFAGVGSSCTVQNNHITWYAYAKGGTPYNKWFDTGSYTTPAGWSTNTGDTAVDPLATSTMLPDPLWTGSPWNTVSAPIISYTPSTNTYTVGTAISTWSATNTGGAATSWSISPSLPAGLSFNTSTGDITGTPTAASASTSYTVTATNTGGSGNTPITIQVNASGSSIVIKRKIIII